MEKQYQNDEVEIDLQELFFALLDRIWTILFTTVIGAVIAAVVTVLAITPMYDSSTMIYIKNSNDLSALSMVDLQVSSALTSDYMVLVKSRPVINKVISNLELDMTYEELCDMISVANPSDTRILTITVKNQDPEMAKTLVDELTQVMVKRTAEIMDTTEPSIVEGGTVSVNPVSPNLKKNIAIGAILGGLLAAAWVVITVLLNDSIKNAEDVERYLGLNTLGTIPMREGMTKKEEKKRERQRHRARVKSQKRRAK